MEKNYDEKVVLKEMQNDFKKVASFLNSIVNVKVGEPGAVDKVEKTLQGLPSAVSLVETIETLRQKYSSLLNEMKQERIIYFKKCVSDYLRTVKEEGRSFRETAAGWRVGCLEMETRDSQALVRFRYNREPLTVWRLVSSSENIIKLEKEALNSLEKAKLSSDYLIRAAEMAYEFGCAKRQDNIVPILEFFREFRLALFRIELENKEPSVKVLFAEFPKWAFLFNLDQYRQLSIEIPMEKRIGFQTGSQQEVSKGKGLVLNGLNAMDEYKVMCYVISTKGRQMT